MDDVRIGGPFHSEPICKKCGKQWKRYHLGSHDWQYRDCPKCDGEEYADKLLGKKKMTDFKFTDEDFGFKASFQGTSHADRANAKIAPLVAENLRLRVESEHLEFDTECPHCEEMITVKCRSSAPLRRQINEMQAELTALKAKLEVAVECLRLCDIEMCDATQSAAETCGKMDGHMEDAKARIEELGRKA